MFLKKLIRMNSRFMHRMQQKLMPSLCILCGYPADPSLSLCTACHQDLPSLPDSCRQCGQFLTTSLPLSCGACLNNPPPFDLTHTLFPYEFPIISLIIRLKFQQQLSHAHAFGQLFIEKIQHHWYRHLALPDLLLPIPLHPKRLQERGFNQTLEIAKPIAKAFSIPLDIKSVKRVKHTKAQSSLPAAKRKENMAGAFAADRDYSGLTVAVLDDVITTGQTISAFCQTLKRHGAKSIHIWCCARRG